MIPASVPTQRPPDARLLVIDERGAITHRARADFPTLVRAGDVVVANDAATLPASLAGVHLPTGGAVEVRLAGRDSLLPAGRDPLYRRRVRRRRLSDADRAPAAAARPAPRRRAAAGSAARDGARACSAHPRLIEIRFENPVADIWEGLARHGRPIQYAYVPAAAGDLGHVDAIRRPAGGVRGAVRGIHPRLGRRSASLRARGAAFATPHPRRGHLLDGRRRARSAAAARRAVLTFRRHTAALIEACRSRGGRVIAIGTTVVRALEARGAIADGTVRPGGGIATQRIGPLTPLRCVDAIVSGTHEPGTSHYELLRAFQDDDVLCRMESEAEARGYRTHEFGDSVFIAAGRLHPQPASRVTVHALSDFTSCARSCPWRRSPSAKQSRCSRRWFP